MRQGLRLLVVPILQAVFDIAQKAVGRQQRCHAFRRHHAEFGEFAQRLLRAFQLQRAHLAAAYHLENLRDKFYFADAARAEFDVVFHALAADFGADLAVQRAHCVVCAVIEVFAEHKRAHQRRNAVFVRRYHAAFAPRIAFPLAPVGGKILFQRGFAAHQCARVAVGTQPHIDAEHLPVGGGVVQQRDQLAADFGKKLLIVARPPPVGFARFGIDENQIDVGGYV